MKKQVESTWASERMANALLRERINDVAGEVVRVAHALEGLGSPIDTMLAGKVAELDAANNSSKPPEAMTPRACSPTASARCRSARRGCHRPEDHRPG